MNKINNTLAHEQVMAILKEDLPYLKDYFGVKRIALFGSFAKGIPKKNSDIDILVEFEKPIGLKFIQLAEHIEKLLGRKVDILTPGGIEGIRIKQVAQNIRKSIVYV